MSIRVNTAALESKAAYANNLASQLKDKVAQINSIYRRLDSDVKSRQSIDSSMRSLLQRMEKAEQKLYNVSSFLSSTAARYESAEKVVVANGARLATVSSNGAVGGDWSVGAATGSSSGGNNLLKDFLKIAVGVAVVGVAVAAAVTIGGPILIGMAVGAVIGAAAGSIIGGVSSKMSGGSFLDGFSDGFMWGAIGGAASGALDGVGLGLAGIATGNGLVNSSIYAGQTLVNGGHVTAAGIATSFAVGAGMSVLGSAVSGKISGVVSKDVAETASKNLTQVESNVVEGYSGDLMSPEEAARYSEHWRELGIGSDKTWKSFSEANPGKTIDDYNELVNGMSPWPIGQSGTPNVLKAGDRFYMAVENNAPRSSIGGFGVKEEIPNTQFIRENLAVKSNWKETCNKIREFQVNDGVTLNVLEGPVGPQIDLPIDTYLPGDMSITQYDLFSKLVRGINRGDYVHIVDEFWVD